MTFVMKLRRQRYLLTCSHLPDRENNHQGVVNNGGTLWNISPTLQVPKLIGEMKSFYWVLSEALKIYISLENGLTESTLLPFWQLTHYNV